MYIICHTPLRLMLDKIFIFNSGLFSNLVISCYVFCVTKKNMDTFKLNVIILRRIFESALQAEWRRQAESCSAGGRFSQDVVFSVPRCVSPHISTRVYQSFYHLAAAVSPSGKRKQDTARSHTNTCRGPGRWVVVGGVNDLSRSRIRPRL